MKKIILILILSVALSANIKEAPAQTQLISTGISLLSNISGSLTGESAADAQELYNLVTNWKCLKSKFNFYMSFIMNNNDCNFNIDRQKIQDQMNVLDAQMIQAGQNAFSMISGMVKTASGSSSQSTGQQISSELKSALTAVKDIEHFVDLICDEIRKESDNQVTVILSGSYSGHEISQATQSVL